MVMLGPFLSRDSFHRSAQKLLVAFASSFHQIND
jgi:hypothetical protein